MKIQDAEDGRGGLDAVCGSRAFLAAEEREMRLYKRQVGGWGCSSVVGSLSSMQGALCDPLHLVKPGMASQEDTKPYVRSKGRKFERARGRRAS